MDYINWLKNNLDEDRFNHSIGVSEKAEELAIKFGLDTNKAKLAGLVHDCAKCLSKDETMEIITKKITIEQCEMINPKTYHAPVGAYIAKEV